MATNTELAKILRGYFSPEYKGVLLEVGAAHPIETSISHVFRDLGWTIISIEPNPEFVQEFAKLGLECLPYACCAEDKGKTDFHVSPCPLSSSALEVRYPGAHPIENGAGGWWPAKDFKTVTVEALTLNTVMKRHHPKINSIDILIVDTEGWELDVLRGFYLATFSPQVVLFEYFWSIKESNGILPLLESKNYHKDREEEQDLFYVYKRRKHLFKIAIYDLGEELYKDLPVRYKTEEDASEAVKYMLVQVRPNGEYIHPEDFKILPSDPDGDDPMMAAGIDALLPKSGK